MFITQFKKNNFTRKKHNLKFKHNAGQPQVPESGQRVFQIRNTGDEVTVCIWPQQERAQESTPPWDVITVTVQMSRPSHSADTVDGGDIFILSSLCTIPLDRPDLTTLLKLQDAALFPSISNPMQFKAVITCTFLLFEQKQFNDL